MPELPEVQTTVDGINKKVRGRKIIDVWTDLAVKNPSLKHFKNTTKSSDFFKRFKKSVIGSTIVKAKRRGKNILIELSNDKTIWIHMKMTGHLMYGEYVFIPKLKEWQPSASQKNKALLDPYNKYLHTVFSLENGKQLVLSDVRKFAKVSIFNSNTIPKELTDLGPEPFDPKFNFSIFSNQLLKKPKLPVKLALLDQSLIAGIGNIYSDEALWWSGIHPFRMVEKINDNEMKNLFNAVIESLKLGITLGGDSTSDYRNIDGEKGLQQAHHNAYKQTGKPCGKKNCLGIITRLPFAGRNTHFCPVHQK